MYIVFISALIFSGIETLDLHVQTLRPLDLYILDTLVRPLCPFWYPLSLNLSSLHTTSNSSPTSCWKVLRVLITFFFKKIGQPASFPFMSFQTNNTIFTTKQCEKCPNIHLVYGARIQTHYISPIHQGSHPMCFYLGKFIRLWGKCSLVALSTL